MKPPLSFIIFLYFSVCFDFLNAKSIVFPIINERDSGLIWSKIIVKQRHQNGSITELGTEIYETNNTRKGRSILLLGNGTYEIIFSPDTSTFSEAWLPLRGNWVQEFRDEKVSTAGWISKLKLVSKDNHTYHDMLQKRFTARLIESAIEKGLMQFGFNEEEVKRDVVILDNGGVLDGKFACFANDIAIRKYTMVWKGRIPTKPHQSVKAYNSPEILNSDVLMVLYDGERDTSDPYPAHLGMIRKGFLNHSLESLPCVLRVKKGCNLARKNALRVRRKCPGLEGGKVIY